MNKKSLFESIVFREAEGDEQPPDIDDTGQETTDIIPDDTTENTPPDTGDTPPDIGDIDTTDPTAYEDEPGTDDSETSTQQEPVLSEKISLIMNSKLYQRFLTLLNTVDNQVDSIKDNNEILYSISPKSTEGLKPLSKLAENIRLYLQYNFLDNNYSKNLLFYNKCLNCMKLLNDIFSKELRKVKQSGG